MSRPEGLPKTGGRKKGTPNKKTELLQESLNSHGVDLVERITKILPQLSLEKQADILMQFMPYVYPRRKATEITAELNQPSTFSEIVRIALEEADSRD